MGLRQFYSNFLPSRTGARRDDIAIAPPSTRASTHGSNCDGVRPPRTEWFLERGVDGPVDAFCGATR
jgi:hypothetical protein